ncbi:MAG: single-stranded DNA-binding protein [Firmicutes bacterium]|nr:single-stranded DNA-binding protein [Bacillota bacterium]
MNHVVLVGRLVEEPKVTTTETGKQVTSVTVAVTRNFKNPEGIYESDFIRCVLWNGIAANTSEYCHTGDVIGVKGRLQTSNYNDENGKRHFVMEVVAEKVTFLSSNKNKEVKNEEVKSSNSSKKSKKGE